MRRSNPASARVLRFLAWAWILGGSLRAAESNFWPVEVRQQGPGGSWSALGPFLFGQTFAPGAPVPDPASRRDGGAQPAQPGDRISGFRPLYVQRTLPGGELAEATILYPFFVYRSYGDSYRWSVFSLVNRTARKEGAPPPEHPEERTTEIWPFYFHRETGDPSTSYQGLLPIAGNTRGHLGYDSINWVLFPLYARTLRAGATTDFTPWPIIRTTTGSQTGFAIWPLFGRMERPGAWTRNYVLWPLTWNNTIQPAEGAPPGTAPRRQVGFLPFYTSDRGPDGVDENFLWPFFGSTDRVAPTRYHETRYLWPFLVRGRGDDATVDRVGPFYTHSVRKGVEKTWVLWPLWRRIALTESGLVQEKTQFFYFVGWNLEQRSATRPAAAPARKTFIWPLCSDWDNGAGRRQFQFPSLLDVFFPDNEEVRESWTPLVTLLRHEDAPDGASRTSLLWNAVTWEKHPVEGRACVHVGPVFSSETGPGGRRVALGGGLFGLRRAAGGGWRPFWLEFSQDPNITRSAAK